MPDTKIRRVPYMTQRDLGIFALVCGVLGMSVMAILVGLYFSIVDLYNNWGVVLYRLRCISNYDWIQLGILLVFMTIVVWVSYKFPKFDEKVFKFFQI